MTSPVTREIKDVDLFVNSANRDMLLSASSTDFRINITNPINAKILLCGLKSVTFPNGVYNVLNGDFQITDSGGIKNISITPGNYTASSLATAIQTQLNALAVDTYVVTVTDGKFVFASTFAGFTINPGALLNVFLEHLGFPQGDYTGAIITAPNVYDLSGIKNAFIKIAQISSFIRNSYDVKYNFKFDLSCGFGGVIYFSNEGKYLQEYNVEKDNLIKNTFFNIQLVDEYGTVIDNNGLDWNFTLKLTTQNLNLP